ncbi:hypothetical protein GCM10010400_30530 [Streptomyces aculeolatus]|uniref:hypothetical protein n=1 Tax=Streptomyces aculeolatus TaxID=270689 RepID=UPI001CED7AC9|nr:hypothetical protein [Streptomyces aculeolatus]
MPPTEVVVQQLAGRDHHGFGRRIKYLAEECVPWVEPVTGLALPERLVIRLLDRTALRQTIIDDQERLVAAALAEATGDHDVDKVIKLNRAIASVSSRIAWWVAGGITYTTAAGDPEIMITPGTWRHHGQYRDDDALMAMLSHELIHPAQFHASGGRLPVMDTGPLGKDLGLADREIKTVGEGHATYFGVRIATKVLGGNPVLWVKGRRYRRSLRYKLIGGMISRLPMAKKAGNAYNNGAWFTAHVLDGLGELPGLDQRAFNGLWARRDLFPDADEIRYPDTWLKKVTPELTLTSSAAPPQPR